MRNYLILVIMGIFLASCSRAPGHIVIKEKKYVLGEAPSGLLNRAYFEGKNNGGKEVRLLEVELSCGCLKWSFSPENHIVKPGESFTLGVILDLPGYSGKVFKTIKLRFDNGQETVLTIEGEIGAALYHKNIKGKTLFDFNCMRCHLLEGYNRYGADLYNATCRLCHKGGVRKVGKGFDLFDYLSGKKGKHPLMIEEGKSFSLTEKQVKSLVKYLGDGKRLNNE